ncbi:GntR family transcriptional regulator [Paractinoplanes ferrugineus]|uniref:GntR family transcriptional regulator n=1 Tax=Paractinoplanes ferrugineus TaxID=113564 RepID=A0A919JBJ8_9ACTN|nr:GntR family transcriptional regulator [Actinoplanes ferrugineus]GIE16807.1 GntR family transcriptional regulator [Actinoplanes ferrugineus]
MTAPLPMPNDGVRQRQQQIAANIRALILSGDLMPGDKLPSTTELMAEYNVANQTVQRALNILKNEKFIESHKGKGIFVAARAPQVVRAGHYPVAPAQGQPYPWITDHANQGRRGSSDLISVGETPAPAQVAAAFGIDKGTAVVTRHQLLKLDGEPAELVWLYYPVEIARGTPLAEQKKFTGGSPRVLADLGFPQRGAIDQVGTRLATVEEFVALELPEDMPVLRTFRVVFTDDQRPVEVQVMVKAGQQYEVQYRLSENGD